MNYTSREVYEHISKQTNDPIVEWKICAVSGVDFPIYQSDLNFYNKVSPSFAGQKFHIPTPTLCPEERQRRRLMFRNERKLYKGNCDHSNKAIISIYAPESDVLVYDQKIRWSDARDPLEYGFEFDFTKTFTENFQQLARTVPRCNLITDYSQLERSDFVHLAGPSKDCYLIIETDRCERCMYSYSIFDSNACIDCNNITDSEKCFQCIDIKHGYHLHYCQQCHSCKNSIACVNCQNISDCFGCHNLTAGQYMIHNKQHTQQEYEEFIATLDRSTIPSTLKQVRSQTSYKYSSGINNHGHIYGDHINNSQNAVFCYDVDEVRDCKYCTIIHHAQDCMDYLSRGENSSLVYETHNSGSNNQNILFSDFTWNSCSHIIYSHLCPSNNQHLFGCVGLKNKKYCIFNKQYSKEEYEIQVAKIITHMQSTGERGEFFHPSVSAFGYNETVAQEYYPLNKEEATQRGLSWQDLDYPINVPASMETILASQLPNIDQVSDDILTKAIICEVSGKPFRIMKMELDFYRTQQEPIPRFHPDIRHQQRVSQRPAKHLELRSCDHCHCNIISTHSDTQQGSIYCESCYQHQIFG